jgi:hypothetical protein
MLSNALFDSYLKAHLPTPKIFSDLNLPACEKVAAGYVVLAHHTIAHPHRAYLTGAAHVRD